MNLENENKKKNHVIHYIKKTIVWIIIVYCT